MEIGLLLLRTALALLLLGHAGQKVFGWFRGAGLEKTAAIFHGMGFRPARPMVLAAALAETAGAVLLLTGTATPLAAAIVCGTMIVAASANFSQGLWAQQGGYEVALTYGLIAAALAFTGPGGYSVDRVLGIDQPSAAVAAGALVLAVLAALPVLLRKRALLNGAPAEEGKERE